MERRIATYLLFLLLPLTLAAQGHQTDIERLTKEMYRLFSSHEVEQFMNVTDQLKEACLKEEEEGLFYRAWANQASFIFTKVSREEGMEIAKAMNEYAQQHDSKLGIYYSSVTNANQAASLRMEIKAEEYFLKALKYKQTYLPQINAAPAYLGLAKIYYNRRNQKKILEMADKALKEPNLTGPSIVDAWSYRCFAAMYNQEDELKTELNKVYEEWKRLSEKYKYRSSFTTDIEIYHAQVNGDYEKMLELAKKIKSPLERSKHLSHAYKWLGKWKDALQYQIEYKRISDSINTADIRKQTAEHAMQMDIIRAENEAKELKLHNQALRLEHQESELEQERLEKEALDLTLKNREIALQNASVQLKNDSLDRQAQQLKLSEYESKLQARKHSERARTITMWAAIVIGLLIISFLSLYLYRHKRHEKILATAYDKLQDAYDQLEQTTKAKERYESELRIARDIQMSMVPTNFPTRKGLDLYATMEPAKQVGGDMYGYLLHDDDLYFCVGDVSGKGIPASLFMTQATRLFHALATQHLTPALIATEMNAELTEGNETGMFITMFIGLVNLDTGHLSFCNAGHTPPLLDNKFLEVESNAPIGLWPELSFVGEEIDNIKGSLFFTYTDGLNEAEDIHQVQFGDERIQHILSEGHLDNARQTISRLKKEVDNHRCGAEPNDDITMLCLRIN